MRWLVEPLHASSNLVRQPFMLIVCKWFALRTQHITETHLRDECVIEFDSLQLTHAVLKMPP